MAAKYNSLCLLNDQLFFQSSAVFDTFIELEGPPASTGDKKHNLPQCWLTG